MTQRQMVETILRELGCDEPFLSEPVPVCNYGRGATEQITLTDDGMRGYKILEFIIRALDDMGLMHHGASTAINYLDSIVYHNDEPSAEMTN